jgi:hypothetical protein
VQIQLRNVGGQQPVLGTIHVDDAARLVHKYCTTPGSGWAEYDLARIEAHPGAFDWLSPWSMTYADALAGQVKVKDVFAFASPSQAQQRPLAQLATLLANIDRAADLTDMTDLTSVLGVCSLAFEGAAAAKITKVAAIFRPGAIPILDSRIAQAFGLSEAAFAENDSSAALTRRTNAIQLVVRALQSCLRDYKDAIGEVRRLVHCLDAAVGADLEHVPDLRLLDIILWTSAARLEPLRRGSINWDSAAGAHIPRSWFSPVRV